MKPLNLAEFRRMVAAYGADLARWPDELREPACALLAESAEARELSAAERGLDQVLQDYSPLPLEPALERRLNEIPLRARRGIRFRPRALWAPALGWAAAALCGVWLGTAYPDDESAEASDDVPVAVAGDDALLELASGAFVDFEEEP
jgi:hypothetical protein